MAVVIVILISALVKESVSLAKNGNIQVVRSCDIGNAIQNDYVKCICTQRSIYRCVHKLTSVVNYTPNPIVLGETACQPNMIYEYDVITCICTRNGTWPHTRCAELLQSLPESGLAKTKCEPNTYTTVECNICRCDANGSIDKDHCTNNECNTQVATFDHRRSTEGNKLYGDCDCGNWYSLAPCQFCYCVNRNKLVCNTGTRLMTNEVYLQLGAYNMHICGKELLKDLKNLVRDNKDPLREGNNYNSHNVEPEITSKSTTQPKATTKPTAKPAASDSNHNVYVKKNALDNTAPIQKDNVVNVDGDVLSSMSKDSLSEEEKAIDPNIGNYQKQSTKIPFLEDLEDEENAQSDEVAIVRQGNEDLLDDEIDDDASPEAPNSGLAIPIANKVPTYQLHLKITSSRPPITPKIPHKPVQVLRDLGQQMKFSLPMMLDTVFKMALRKSMVTLNKDKNCTPGAVETVNCNTCFCLKNSKMLCTNNKCDSN